ncbi:phage tail assembly protein [Meridianimarinicoccus sp. RP-17]|jgi:hypothetical protein|uniref:phage tail assembly protein n=1 Tax=Meridianimarinicoccus zhengii TaxID=2056810 RepID=UPI000DAEEF87|nr:phage tail assembly protein [Phycocomes zhengii]
MTRDAKIDLDWPISVGGTEVQILTMRRPRVIDIRVAQEQSAGDSARKELILLRNLLEITEDELDQVDIADYGKLQEALKAFMSPRPRKSGRGR